jgi:hypothetical protein
MKGLTMLIVPRLRFLLPLTVLALAVHAFAQPAATYPPEEIALAALKAGVST